MEKNNFGDLDANELQRIEKIHWRSIRHLIKITEKRLKKQKKREKKSRKGRGVG